MTTKKTINQSASAFGIDPLEMLLHLVQDERWCGGHRAWHPSHEFGADRSRKSGLAHVCREYRRERRLELIKRKQAKGE